MDDDLEEDEWCVVVVAFVVIAGLSRVCCLSDCLWCGRRCRDDRGRWSCWLLESAHNVAFHGVPFRAILCRGEPDLVNRCLCWF